MTAKLKKRLTDRIQAWHPKWSRDRCRAWCNTHIHQIYAEMEAAAEGKVEQLLTAEADEKAEREWDIKPWDDPLRQ